MTRRMSSRRVALTATFAMLAMGGLAACDNASDEDPNEDGVFYCTDDDGKVVPEDYCDDSNQGSSGGGGFFFMYMGSSMHGNSTYPVGSKMPAGAQKFSVTDKAARTRFGLPATGRVNNGTIKTGVIGKGGPGSSLPKTGTVGKSSGGGAKSGGGSGGAKGGSSGG
jgi:hypothetical protein